MIEERVIHPPYIVNTRADGDYGITFDMLIDTTPPRRIITEKIQIYPLKDSGETGVLTTLRTGRAILRLFAKGVDSTNKNNAAQEYHINDEILTHALMDTVPNRPDQMAITHIFTYTKGRTPVPTNPPPKPNPRPQYPGGRSA